MILSDALPELEMMLVSLTYLMCSVCLKDLPCHINVHRTTFDGYNDNIEDDNISQASSGISISDLNAQIGHSGKFALIFEHWKHSV